MVRRNITRWHPDTCKCVIDRVSDYTDDNSTVLSEPKFLLMNEVCQKHEHLKSTTRKENHIELSQNVMDIIEEAKTVNMKQVDNALATAKRARHIRDLTASKQHIQARNNQITEEWNELVSEIHAFDSHIYEQVLKENSEKIVTPELSDE